MENPSSMKEKISPTGSDYLFHDWSGLPLDDEDWLIQ